MPNLIESLRVKGFRSLADVEIDSVPRSAVLVGANGSGKSNFFRFFEMMNWMIGAHRLAEFIQYQGGADDQLFGGSKISPRMEAELAIRNESGRTDYRFALAYVHPGRFMFAEEAIRFTCGGRRAEAAWQHFGSGHTEARIVEAMRPGASHVVNQRSTDALSQLARHCIVHVSRHLLLFSVEDGMRSDGKQLPSVEWQKLGCYPASP